MGDKEAFSRLLGGLDHRVGISQGGRDGFFDENVLSRPESLYGDRPVKLHRQADIDQVDVGIGEKIPVIGIGTDSRQVLHPSLATQVAANVGPVARKLCRVPGADRKDPSASKRLRGV